MFSINILNLAKKVVQTSAQNGLTISTAESCTGGLIISALTEISGSSTVVERGFITYSNQSKIDMLNVNENTIIKFGAVSRETVEEMAQGAWRNSGSNITIVVSGIAGPTGESEGKPIGLVHFALCINGKIQTFQNIFKGTRADVRFQAVETALTNLFNAVSHRKA